MDIFVAQKKRRTQFEIGDFVKSGAVHLALICQAFLSFQFFSWLEAVLKHILSLASSSRIVVSGSAPTNAFNLLSSLTESRLRPAYPQNFQFYDESFRINVQSCIH